MILPGRPDPATLYPAGVPGLASRFVTTRSGTRVHVVDGGEDRGRGVAVLVHGWGCHAYVFRHLVRPLADAGYRVLLPDLKGHGRSDKPLGESGYSLAAMAEQLGEVLDALDVPHAAVLAGHSLGGAVAARLTMTAPGRVGRLALFAPVGFGRVSMYRLARRLTPRAVAPLLPWLAARWLFRAVMFGAYGPRHRITREDVDQYWTPSRWPEFVRALRNLVHAFDWEPLDDGALRALRVPVLVVFGQRDRVVSPADSARRAALLPDGRLEMVPGAGHVVPEEAPERASALLMEFAGRPPSNGD